MAGFRKARLRPLTYFRHFVVDGFAPVAGRKPVFLDGEELRHRLLALSGLNCPSGAHEHHCGELVAECRPKTVTGVIKSWSSEKVTLDVSGKPMEFKMQGDFAKLQEGPLAKPVGRKVEVTYQDDQTESVKVATRVIVDPK